MVTTKHAFFVHKKMRVNMDHTLQVAGGGLEHDVGHIFLDPLGGRVIVVSFPELIALVGRF